MIYCYFTLASDQTKGKLTSWKRTYTLDKAIKLECTVSKNGRSRFEAKTVKPERVPAKGTTSQIRDDTKNKQNSNGGDTIGLYISNPRRHKNTNKPNKQVSFCVVAIRGPLLSQLNLDHTGYADVVNILPPVPIKWSQSGAGKNNNEGSDLTAEV